jgi:hypothetical protein
VTPIARVFFDTVVKLHGMPSSIVSDRDPTFTGRFWRELFTMTGVKLQFMSAFHPQANKQSKAMNKIVTMYLRCLTGDRPHDWLWWLAWVEYCYNSSFQSSLRTTPFKVIYGRDLSSMLSYSPREVRLSTMQAQLRDRDEFLIEVRDRLKQMQQHHKEFYDHKHMALEFEVGELAWLWLLHRPIASLDVCGRGKLGPKFYGPFKASALERWPTGCSCRRELSSTIGSTLV